jgi:hypothetical protein
MWSDLLQKKDERIVLPWLGGRKIRSGQRVWELHVMPPEFGWYEFVLAGRHADVLAEADPVADVFGERVRGYLVGDRIVPDGVNVDPNPTRIVEQSEPVRLLDEGLTRFVRVEAGRTFEGGPLVFVQEDMPLGPELEVTAAYQDQKESLDDVPGVSPALDAAFRMEVFHRKEAQRRREELERQRQEDEKRRALEARRKQILEDLGDGQERRAMAKVDFEAAARASLAVGGAQYLDHRAVRRGEMAVTFRFKARRFECTCDKDTLRIIDSGICLQDHDTGEKGDRYFTLESLPGVIQEADRDGKLVVYRHLD